jgi:hypothetical protein
LTILSPNWNDSLSSNSYSSRVAANDTVNAAIVSGNVPTTDTTATGFSGGVQNFPRLLEDWSESSLWLNTSIVCLFPSAQATAQFQMPGNYYEPPTRHFSFDPNLMNPATLPPGTPMQTFVERISRSTPRPTADPSQ